MIRTTARDTRFRNNNNQISGWNLYNESQVHFSWDYTDKKEGKRMVRKPSPVLVMYYIETQQYNTAAAVADHYYKLYMDHDDYFERIWDKSDQLNTTIAVGTDKNVSLNTYYIVPKEKTAPTEISYSIVGDGVGAISEAEFQTWFDAVLAAMDVKPEMIVMVTNGFVSVGAGWNAFSASREADKRYIYFNVCVIPYTAPNTQYWLQDITRALEVTNGIISMDFGDT